MKLYVEDAVYEKDGKKTTYQRFYVYLFNNTEKYVLKIADKMAKVLIADNIDSAEFTLKICTSKDGKAFEVPVVHVNVGGSDYETNVLIENYYERKYVILGFKM